MGRDSAIQQIGASIVKDFLYHREEMRFLIPAHS